MRALIVCLSLIVVCAAQVPTPCQAPKQWEARRFRMDRTKKFAEIAKHTYDEVNRRTRSIEEIQEGVQKAYYDVIHLHNEGKEYRLNLQTKKCNVSTPRYPFRPVGVPSDAKFLFEAEIGPVQVPGEHLTAQAWDGKFADNVDFQVRVTSPDCIPIGFDVVNTSTDEFFFERYYDLHGGITDPSVFIPPPECM